MTMITGLTGNLMVPKQRLANTQVSYANVTHSAGDISFSITYMLLEYIDSAISQLLRTWDCYHDDYKLLQSISRIILSLACIPHAYIGLFQLHDRLKTVVCSKILP